MLAIINSFLALNSTKHDQKLTNDKPKHKNTEQISSNSPIVQESVIVSPLLNLPLDILDHILFICDQKTVGRLRQTCSQIKKFSHANAHWSEVRCVDGQNFSAHDYRDLRKLFI